MNHPIHILPAEGSLRVGHMEELAANCSSSKPDPTDPNRTVFTFLARDVNDSRDRTVVADPAAGRYTADRAEGCVCEGLRTPLECQCQTSQCGNCSSVFVAIESTCEYAYCLYDECPLCTHQRESCNADALELGIREGWESLRVNQPSETDADILYGAVAEVLGAGSGDAPNFPVVRRILGRIAGVGEDESAWTLPDGSVLRLDSRNPAWLDSPRS